MLTSSSRRGRGVLEAAVMAVLWNNGPQRPLTAGDVHARLGSDLAYTTIQTVLSRLHGRGHVQRRQNGRGHLYWPINDQAPTAATEMIAALAGRDDRRKVLGAFAAELAPQDARTLRALLDAPV